MPIKIATWNVNSVRSRLSLVNQWINETSPDVILLQETKVEDHQFPLESFEERGYNYALYGQKTYNGVAILSRLPMEDVHRGLHHDDPQARYIEAVVGGKIRVASVYVPNGESQESEKYAYKLGFLTALSHHVADRLTFEEAFIIGGDYNIAPLDKDITYPEKWKNHVMCTHRERAAYQSIMAHGLYDAILARHGHDALDDYMTWWDYRGGAFGRNDGVRIDHLLLSPQAIDRLDQSGVDRMTRTWDTPSDHAPVWCTLDL